MNTKIAYIVLMAFFAFIAVSCEKTSMDEYNEYVEEYTSSPGQRPSQDGNVIETGRVDLGLSVEWAACNLSKTTSNHFAPMCSDVGTKDFDWTFKSITYPPLNISGTQYDNATALLGGQWRTPTKAEVHELFIKCRVTKKMYRGVDGYIVTGPSGKAIFVPSSQYGEVYLTGTYDANAIAGIVWIMNDLWDQSTWFVDYSPGFRGRYIRPVFGPMK